jgi:uncharacterized repeat protein (TIGR03803 family)
MASARKEEPMSHRILTDSSRAIAAVFAAVAVLAPAEYAIASHVAENILYSFRVASGGYYPGPGLVADSAGNLYGITSIGGDPTCNCGTVFELSPPASQGGEWTETVLYAFHGGDNDGGQPQGTLISDKLGNLYGTAANGSSKSQGVVFELSPPATTGGAWKETVIFFFAADGSQGRFTLGNLIFDGVGNLYGTARYGGTVACGLKIGCGTVFQLRPPATPGGSWTPTVLHSFGAVAGDGKQPGTNLTFRAGALYGTTTKGGAAHTGTIFRLVLQHGIWQEKILHSFAASESPSSGAGLIFDDAGNIYGTLSAGGVPNSSCSTGCGAVYELSPPAVTGGPWKETTLYSFTGVNDGGFPQATLTRDKLNNLFGTTATGVSCSGCPTHYGTVFKLKPPSAPGGTWTEVTLYQFGNDVSPRCKLLLRDGTFFGTTVLGGGADNVGTVFSLAIVP